jgi:hypothetical protein
MRPPLPVPPPTRTVHEHTPPGRLEKASWVFLGLGWLTVMLIAAVEREWPDKVLFFAFALVPFVTLWLAFKDRRPILARPSGPPYRNPGPWERVEILPLVVADLHARIAKGQREYGEPLTSHNGRDALLDAYEESQDMTLYLKQALVERDAFRADRAAASFPTEQVGQV